MQRKVINLLMALALMSLMASVASAQAPSTMTYQGRLTNAAGTPITTATDVTFSIYYVSTGGVAVWSETISITPDANGLFSVVLGNSTPLTAAVFYGGPAYLGIQVGADAEMSPRQLLNSAPYSVNTGTTAGFAQGIMLSDSHFPTTAAMTDAVTVTITIPAAGYIIVEATGQAAISGTTSSNYMIYQIDETAGGTYDINYEYNIGLTVPPNTGTMWWPVSMRRTYFKGAGTYTFRFEGQDMTGFGTKWVFNPVITATYMASAFGSVQTVVSSEDASAFDQVTTVSVTPPSQQLPAESHTRHIVDLRELENKPDPLAVPSDSDR